MSTFSHRQEKKKMHHPDLKQISKKRLFLFLTYTHHTFMHKMWNFESNKAATLGCTVPAGTLKEVNLT